MNTLKTESKLVITDGILKGFVDSLVSHDDPMLSSNETMTHELAHGIIKALGGESEFLSTYRNIADFGLRKTRCRLTSDDAVRLNHQHSADMKRAVRDVLDTRSHEYLMERVFMRIGHLKAGQLQSIFDEVQVFEDVVSDDRRALCELMADMCIENFCENFLNHHDDMFNMSSAFN